LSDEQFERLKSELEAHYQGAANAGRPLLLEGGLDWKGLSLSPKDMDFVEAKHIAAREIALSFGVPPMLLGIPGDNTYSNYAEANRAFYRQTVVPLISRIASALGNWLGENFGGNLRLAPDLDEVPALSIEREALWKRVGEASFLTDDEKRAAAGYEPLPASSLTTLLAKYSPDQPRVPAGSREGGQWTSGGGYGGGEGGDNAEGEEGDQELLPENARPIAAQSAITEDAIFRNPQINKTSVILVKTLAEAMNKVRREDYEPAQYGSRVHKEFADLLRQKNVEGIELIDIERSFGPQGSTYYGANGSVRPDVILRDKNGKIIAIYDVKTGARGLEQNRADRLRWLTGANPDVPVIELHPIRDLNYKTPVANHGNFTRNILTASGRRL
jgi:hypothetical protein